MQDTDFESVPVAALLGSTIHDAKGALGVLLRQIDDLDELKSSDVVCRAAMAAMREQTLRINHDLVSLLSLYKLEHGLYSLNLDLHSLSDLLLELRLQEAPSARARGIELALSCDADLHACFDYNLLAGVIGNAVANALRHARHRVELRATFDADRRRTRISVEDDGAGFPDALLAGQGGHAEQGFTRGHTGLGLHFARVVADAHRRHGQRGSICIDKRAVLGGARFELELP